MHLFRLFEMPREIHRLVQDAQDFDDAIGAAKKYDMPAALTASANVNRFQARGHIAAIPRCRNVRPALEFVKRGKNSIAIVLRLPCPEIVFRPPQYPHQVLLRPRREPDAPEERHG
jgi:hypothetical protein